jgi:hypothetical protein
VVGNAKQLKIQRRHAAPIIAAVCTIIPEKQFMMYAFTVEYVTELLIVMQKRVLTTNHHNNIHGA